MKIGVLALQGAFAEHEKVLEQLGAECIELRQARNLSEPYDALYCRAVRVPFRESS